MGPVVGSGWAKRTPAFMRNKLSRIPLAIVPVLFVIVFLFNVTKLRILYYGSTENLADLFPASCFYFQNINACSLGNFNSEFPALDVKRFSLEHILA